MTTANLFNLALGDVDKETGKVNYDIITNNGDRNKILATVAASIHTFFSKYPDYAIHLTGNTPSRTRLYQMAITTYFDELSLDLITIDETLDKYTNDPIPQTKIDKCNDAILNTNLLQVLAEIKKVRITKP